MKNTEYKEMIILLGIGEKIVENMKHGKVCNFCKYALDLCWEWIEKNEDIIDKMYDCLDSPDGIDFTYYEEISEDGNEKKICRSMFNILAYITKRISIINKIERPQYLDYITEDFYEKFIKEVTNTYDFLNNIDDKIGKYYDNQIQKNKEYITKKDIKKIIKLE